MAGIALTAYRMLSPLLPLALQLLAPASPKLKAFADLRRNLFDELQRKLSALPDPSCRIWVHAASVGEFEQARPVIAGLRERYPGADVVVSFLSDSGYNTRKDFAGASLVFCLPLDTPAHARELVRLLKPDVFLLMRYDFWPNHLAALRKSGAKLLLAAAVLQPDSPYRKPLLKGFYRDVFRLFDAIFTVSEQDAASFSGEFGCRKVTKAGDPRFDQVHARALTSGRENSRLKPLFRQRMVLVAGSTWQQDEAVVIPAWLAHRDRLSLVLVPHKVDPDNIARICSDLERREIGYARISSLPPSFDPQTQTLLVDETGYLAELYSIASIAYVGGGFGVNVHNTLEPAVYGIPVLFGPRHGNSPEADGLLRAGAAEVVSDGKELDTALDRFVGNPALLEVRGALAAAFVQERLGATGIIAGAVEELCRGRKRPV
jgi:3-deoxy-D-manno-octulosonic-acid transferase